MTSGPTDRPACMSDDEWETWNAPVVTDHGSLAPDQRRRHLRVHRTRLRPQSPCVGCPFEFHRAMLAAGTCDGRPVHPNGMPIIPAEEATARLRERWREYGRRRRRLAGT